MDSKAPRSECSTRGSSNTGIAIGVCCILGMGVQIIGSGGWVGAAHAPSSHAVEISHLSHPCKGIYLAQSVTQPPLHLLEVHHHHYLKPSSSLKCTLCLALPPTAGRKTRIVVERAHDEVNGQTQALTSILDQVPTNEANGQTQALTFILDQVPTIAKPLLKFSCHQRCDTIIVACCHLGM